MLRFSAFLALAGLFAAIPQHALGTPPACPRGIVVADGTRSNITSLIAVVGHTVPHAYASMTNQSGRGAWRGYRIRGVVSLARTYPQSPDRTRLLPAAVARCGTSIASASWAVLLSFPNAQTIPASTSTAYFVRGQSGWQFWFHSA
jgi:hypothetical protein